MPLIWAGLHDYQRRRVEIFLNPDLDPLGAGYHIAQSKIAIGSGGVSGKGFLLGTQSQLDFVPEKHTDFIVTILGEEWGFAGLAVLLGLFAVLLALIISMALALPEPLRPARDRGQRRVVVRLCFHQRRDGDGARAGRRHAAAAGLLRGHVDDDADDRARACDVGPRARRRGIRRSEVGRFW